VPSLDTTFVRRQFPAFSEPSLQDWAFFESAGGSYVCQQVLQRLSDFYTRTKVQPYHAYPTAQAAGAAIDASYERLAAYLGVGLHEVHLGPSTSQNSYVLANAFREMWQPGEEIVVTDQDHEANSGVWRKLTDTGIVIREWHVDPGSGLLDPRDLDALLSDKTKMVAYPHCSNVVAHWNPVVEINRKIRTAGAISIVDGVAAAPHGIPNIEDLGADIYMLSLYKTWGPHLGLMTIRQSLMDQMVNQSHFFHAGDPRKMLLPAGPDHAQIAAAAGLADYLDQVYEHHFEKPEKPADRGRMLRQLFAGHETQLLSTLLDWLKDRQDVRILGPADAERRAPTVSILPLNKDIRDVHAVLTEHKLMVATAHFYAARLLQAMAIPLEPGVLRMSFLHYTTESEIQQLLDGLAAALD